MCFFPVQQFYLHLIDREGNVFLYIYKMYVNFLNMYADEAQSLGKAEETVHWSAFILLSYHKIL